MFVTAVLASTLLAMPWSLDASARLTGVGFTPSAQGGGAEVGAAFALAGGRWLQVDLGPRLTVDFTAFSGRFIALSAALELRAKPHALVWLDLRVAYSNTNFMLAAAVVERLTGQPHQAVMNELLFSRLDAPHLTYRPDEFDTKGCRQPALGQCSSSTRPRKTRNGLHFHSSTRSMATGSASSDGASMATSASVTPVTGSATRRPPSSSPKTT
ncbi:MAG: serine hydrolase [Archangium sp.]|nr:serine hydrolase [Archangium sp.]MDP3574241.1 serine hydrolase [Archangium sp.]